MSHQRDPSAVNSALEDELNVFHQLEKETLKVDRSILQQTEAIKSIFNY
jgi:hypothetical protein